MPKGPCYECKERYPCCTDTCEKHKEYFGKKHEIEQKSREEKLIRAMNYRAFQRQKKR